MRPVKGFPSYQISTNGAVIGSKGPIAIFLRSPSNPYLAVSLWRDNKQHIKYLHRLLAENFLEKSKEHTVVNHIDGDKTNNTLSNLEWATHRDNALHAHKTGLKIGKRGEESHFSKLTKGQVLRAKELLAQGEKQKTIAKLFGVSKTAIYSIASGKSWKNL